MPHRLFVWLTSPLYLTFSPVPTHLLLSCSQVSTEFQFKQTDLEIRSCDPHLGERVALWPPSRRACGVCPQGPGESVQCSFPVPFILLQISLFLTVEQKSIVRVPRLWYLLITRWPSRRNPLSSNCEESRNEQGWARIESCRWHLPRVACLSHRWVQFFRQISKMDELVYTCADSV